MSGVNDGRPAGLPFTDAERERLNRLDAVYNCARWRINWSGEFARHVLAETAAGRRAVDVFREAVVGPEWVGYKRTQRFVERGRQRGRRGMAWKERNRK